MCTAREHRRTMYQLTVTLLCALCFAHSLPVEDIEIPTLKDGGKIWALLVAGSNGWDNYRHQADVCHAYHVMKSHGIPEDQIVVMMVDDIAQNEENPTPGVIINQPDGPNVYKGVKIDYSGIKNVVPEVFLKVLKGDSSGLSRHGTGRVIKSNENDHVFVNFVDHGAPGLIAFGEHFLHSSDLMKTLKGMHKKKQFSKMLFYLETCESGSMFYKLLPKDYNILAITAANRHQPSQATYYDKKRKTFLGDVFSVNWLQNSDKENLNSETISKQFKIVKKETNTSEVSEYGDMTIGTMTVSEFQGKQQSNQIIFPAPNANIGAVPSEDVEFEILKHKYDDAKTEEQKMHYMEKIQQEALRRDMVPRVVSKIVSTATNNNNVQTSRIMTSRFDLYRTECYKTVVEYLADNCPRLQLRQQFGYALKHLYVFVNLCEENVAMDTIISAIDKEKSCHMN